MARVTYLFGAGASCECLPLVKNIPTRLEQFRQIVAQYNPPNVNEEFKTPGQTRASIREEINISLLYLIEKVTLHASIDTYAKTLALTANWDYVILKILLSFSFIYDQMMLPVDRRYDAFFASIMKSAVLDFLDIRILSWNYDYQFEKAFSQFKNEYSLSAIQKELNVIPHSDVIRQKDKFSIIKLNGTTSFREVGNQFGDHDTILDDLSSKEHARVLEKLFEYYSEFKNRNTKIRSLIGFGWETTGLAQNILVEGKRDIVKSKALVIVGYSFPFFNREIDRQIFAELNEDVKIYVQDIDPESVISNLKSVLPERKTFKYEPIPKKIIKSEDPRDFTQFYLPAEL